MWIKAPSSVSSVTRRSSSNVPLALAVTQSPPPASTLPRRRSPSKEPPLTGKMESLPCGVEPISSVAEVVRRTNMSGREFIGVVPFADSCGRIRSGAPAHTFEWQSARPYPVHRGASKASSSEHFVDRVNRTFCATVAAGHCDETIQERVRGVCSLEARRGAKIVGRGIDRLATSDGRDHLRRSVTQGERLHRNERAALGP